MSSSSSVVVLRKSDASAAVGFSLWTSKMKNDMESHLLMPKQGKADQEESKKKLCMCAPTSHPGSFRCRYHRSISVQKVKPVQDPAVVARHFLKLGSKGTKPTAAGVKVKPQLSRFSKAAAAAAEVPR